MPVKTGEPLMQGIESTACLSPGLLTLGDLGDETFPLVARGAGKKAGTVVVLGSVTFGPENNWRLSCAVNPEAVQALRALCSLQLATRSVSLLKQIDNLSVSKFTLTPSVPLSLSLSFIGRGASILPITRALLHHPLFHPVSTVGSEPCITKRLSWKA